ncbi:hypothetical protein [Cohnella cellulosilytica]|uniref:t-SNARE coiled-coil homology domain-containing protein n=1 Tax=Cohnella cellulosilytica TaxID=986710 RepID=A0ABW2F4A1_9BACL
MSDNLKEVLQSVLAEALTPIHVRLDRMDDRFDRIEGRLDQMDDRFDRIEGRLDQMDGRFDRMEDRLDQMDGRLDQMETGFSSRLDRVEGRLDRMETDITEMKKDTALIPLVQQAVLEANNSINQLNDDVQILKDNQQTVINIQQEQQKILERLSVRSISHEADIAELRRIK